MLTIQCPSLSKVLCDFLSSNFKESSKDHCELFAQRHFIHSLLGLSSDDSLKLDVKKPLMNLDTGFFIFS